MGQEALDYEEWIEMIDNTLFVKKCLLQPVEGTVQYVCTWSRWYNLHLIFISGICRRVKIRLNRSMYLALGFFFSSYAFEH